ncbi:MAG TPA: hypothetical protein VGB25_06130 [Candidatus Binatia bacterium]
MALSPDRVREEILEIMDRSAAAMKRVVDAYVAKQTRERDIHWLALQAAKEYTAAHVHARRLLGPTEPLASAEEVKKALHDASEEVEHYAAYMEVLNWFLGGQPCPVENWQRYGNPGAYGWRFGGSFEDTLALWPASYAYYTTRAKACKESSHWGTAAILACGEGGAVGWHHAMSQLDLTDRFFARIVPIEREIVADELYHGPETIARLAATPPGEPEFTEVKKYILHVRARELGQRNEQFLHPLGDKEMAAIENDFVSGRTKPLELFRSVHLQSLEKEEAKKKVIFADR